NEWWRRFIFQNRLSFSAVTGSFRERFAIHVNADDAQRRFIARIRNFLPNLLDESYSSDSVWDIERSVATELGDVHEIDYLEGLLESGDFLRILQAIEAV